MARPYTPDEFGGSGKPSRGPRRKRTQGSSRSRRTGAATPNEQLDLMLHELLERCVETSAAESGAIYLFDAHQELELRTHVGEPSAPVSDRSERFRHPLLFDRALEQKQAVILRRQSDRPIHGNRTTSGAFSFSATAPILGAREPLGVLIVTADSGRASVNDLIRSVHAVALKLADILEPAPASSPSALADDEPLPDTLRTWGEETSRK